MILLAFFLFLFLNIPVRRKRRPWARGKRNKVWESRARARSREAPPSGPGGSQVTGAEGAGCLERRLSSGPGAVTPWGARAEAVSGGWGWGSTERRERGGGGGRETEGCSLGRARRPRTAFPARAERRTVPRSGEVWAERARAAGAGARLRGGDGRHRRVWVSV